MASFINMIPGDVAQGLIWGIMALGVFMTFKILNFADMTVDGTFATGGAVTVMLIISGVSTPVALLVAVIAGILAGIMTGFFHTVLGIPDILAGILSQMALYSINLKPAVSVTGSEKIIGWVPCSMVYEAIAFIISDFCSLRDTM